MQNDEQEIRQLVDRFRIGGGSCSDRRIKHFLASPKILHPRVNALSKQLYVCYRWVSRATNFV